jgi:hypothetical protein
MGFSKSFTVKLGKAKGTWFFYHFGGESEYQPLSRGFVVIGEN